MMNRKIISAIACVILCFGLVTCVSAAPNAYVIDELDFLKNPKHRYGWIKRHFLNIWLKWALGNSDIIIAGDPTTAFDIHRFYYIPSDRITVRTL